MHREVSGRGVGLARWRSGQTRFQKSKKEISDRRNVEKPDIGDVISTVIGDLNCPASVCNHSLSHKPMCTIIPVENDPYFILSIWGNGPGIVCFLQDWDGKPFFDVDILTIGPKSVTGRPLPPDLSEFYDEKSN